MKKRLLTLLVILLVAAAGVTWWMFERHGTARELVLYGNIDLRQGQLAFNNSDRIAAVLVQEGDHVRKGQLLARLDTSRLESQVAQAAAQAAAQLQVVTRMRNGSRPEEMAQARANVESAKADLVNAERQFERYKNAAEASGGRAVRQQDVYAAKAALDVAVAQLALLRQQLADSELIAPADAVVRTRVMEPGEMATPQNAVFSLAIIDPKWVRAFISEPDLGKIRPGMPAAIGVDAFPQRRFEGWIGFVSPVAEFTPKSVQTEELRTSLVYEVRVFVKDPADELRLGMPASVFLSAESAHQNRGEEQGKRK